MENNIPKVGDIIYIDTELYLSRGEDDLIGGKARVLTVGGQFGDRMVTVEGWPDVYRGVDWKEQESLKAKFGDSWAYKNPDHRPEFNEWW